MRHEKENRHYDLAAFATPGMIVRFEYHSDNHTISTLLSASQAVMPEQFSLVSCF